MKYQNIYNRLRRIEGQIRGIEEMIAKGRSDTEILIQLEAAKSSIGGTIASFAEAKFVKNESGKIELSENEAKNLLRLIKKN